MTVGTRVRVLSALASVAAFAGSVAVPAAPAAAGPDLAAATAQAPITGPNLAYRKPVSASSVAAPGFEASKANDGDKSTRWSSEHANNQWWQVDLGSVRTVGGVEVAWEKAFASSYQIQTSIDGVRWWTAANISATAARTRASAFVPRRARFVGVNCLTRGTPEGFSFWEVRVYGPLKPTPAPRPAANLALGMEASASSVEVPGFEPSMANDGNPTTRWSSAHANNQWWQVDLLSEETVSRVEVAWETAYASSYQVQTSIDGVSWTTVADVSATWPGTKVSRFAPRQARYVRIDCQTRGTPWGFSFWEVRVYK